MSLVKLVEFWKRFLKNDERFYLATVVHVEGSSYRKPGACMLIGSNGQRCGTISGGCLEAELMRKVAWLAAEGPCVQRFRSDFEEDMPHGTGCGGIITVLIQPQSDASPILEAMATCIETRMPMVLQATLTGAAAGAMRSIAAAERTADAQRALAENRMVMAGAEPGELPASVYLPMLPPVQLVLFGAGDDAVPIARFAAELGWRVTIADGRSHLLGRERFPAGVELCCLRYVAEEASQQLSATSLHTLPGLGEDAFVVLLTHSQAQDSALLEQLLSRSLRYLGILGPVHRTRRILTALGQRLILDVEECLARLHAPVGLDIASKDPATIALSIVAEIQAQLEGKQVTIHPMVSGKEEALGAELLSALPLQPVCIGFEQPQ